MEDTKRIEDKIDKLQSDIEQLKRMIEDIHKHVGFVDSLSQVYEHVKNRGIRTIISAKSLLIGN